MAKCPKCEKSGFDLEAADPLEKGDGNYWFVICAGCNTVVGTVTKPTPVAKINTISTQCGEILTLLNKIERKL